jgi:protein involved in polysaccharide export with SLBB domain
LTERYSSNLKAPVIAVRVKTEGIPYQPRVYIGGEVFKPGFVALRPGMTVMQAVIEAGGPRDTAALDNVVLLRKVAEPNEYKPSKLDLAQVFDGRSSADNIELGQSDILVVPKSQVAKVNVIVEQYIIKMFPIRLSVSPL